MDRARAHLEAARELRAGELVIGTSDTLACYLLPPVLAAFRARFPGVELRLDNRPSPATAAAVAERRVHLGVVSLPLPARPGQSTRRPRSGSARCCPADRRADHAARRTRWPAAPAVTWPTWRDHPLLLLDRTTGSRAFLDAALAALPRPPRGGDGDEQRRGAQAPGASWASACRWCRPGRCARELAARTAGGPALCAGCPQAATWAWCCRPWTPCPGPPRAFADAGRAAR